jgi:hypothetical protein
LGLPIYRAEAWLGRAGVPSWPTLKEVFNATGYWRIEEGRGCHLMGEMKRRKCGDFSPIAEVAGGCHGGGTRPSSGGGACSILAWGGRRRLAGPGGPKCPVGRLAAGPIGSEAKKNHFGIKIGFLNQPRLWKIVQGDFGGIFTQRVFLNSSRILVDFRKIQFAMP